MASKYEWICPKCSQTFTGDDSDSLEDRAWDHLERVHKDDSILVRIKRSATNDAEYHTVHEFQPGQASTKWDPIARKKVASENLNFCKVCGRKKDHVLHAKDRRAAAHRALDAVIDRRRARDDLYTEGYCLRCGRKRAECEALRQQYGVRCVDLPKDAKVDPSKKPIGFPPIKAKDSRSGIGGNTVKMAHESADKAKKDALAKGATKEQAQARYDETYMATLSALLRGPAKDGGPGFEQKEERKCANCGKAVVNSAPGKWVHKYPDDQVACKWGAKDDDYDKERRKKAAAAGFGWIPTWDLEEFAKAVGLSTNLKNGPLRDLLAERGYTPADLVAKIGNKPSKRPKGTDMRTAPSNIKNACPYCDADHDPAIQCRLMPVSPRGRLGPRKPARDADSYSKVLFQIQQLQLIQSVNKPGSPAWEGASKKLAPLFRRMAEITGSVNSHGEVTKDARDAGSFEWTCRKCGHSIGGRTKEEVENRAGAHIYNKHGGPHNEAIRGIKAKDAFNGNLKNAARKAANLMTLLETYKGWDIERNPSGLIVANMGRGRAFPIVARTVEEAKKRIDAFANMTGEAKDLKSFAPGDRVRVMSSGCEGMVTSVAPSGKVVLGAPTGGRFMFEPAELEAV